MTMIMDSRFHGNDANVHATEIRIDMCDARFIHPGEDLAEHLGELGISQFEFAKVIGVTPYRVSQIMNRRAPVTADMAMKIGRAFGQSAEFWMNLQQMYDLEVARATVDVSAIEPLYEPLPDDWTPPLESEEDAKRRDAASVQDMAVIGEAARV